MRLLNPTILRIRADANPMNIRPKKKVHIFLVKDSIDQKMDCFLYSPFFPFFLQFHSSRKRQILCFLLGPLLTCGRVKVKGLFNSEGFLN